jgi:hypothetical protein
MKNKKLNETNNIKLILSNKKLLIRKIVNKGKKKKKLIITHFLEPKPESHTWVASASSRPRLKTKRVKRAVSGVEHVQFLL